MKKSRILSMILVLAMVLSMVVLPVAADDTYAIKLSDAEGNTAISAPAGTTVDVYLSTVGTCPGFSSVGAYVFYPEDWEITTTDLGSALLNQDGITRVNSVTNDTAEDTNPTFRMWSLSAGTTNGGTTEESISYVTGNLAKFTFTIPRHAELGTYDITLNTTFQNPNWVFPHDENGVITSWLPEAMEVPGINCTIQVTESEDADTCPVHEGKPVWDDATAALWGAGGNLTTGHYKLTENIPVTAALTVADGQEVCIDLNGFNITASATYKNPYRVFEIAEGGMLTVMDKTAKKVDGVYTSGAISGGYMYITNEQTPSKDNYIYLLGGNIYNEGTFNLYSGKLSGGTARTGKVYTAGRGGNYYGAANSVMNMYGGLITAGRANTSSYTINVDLWVGGANICSVGTVNINGGAVTGGTVVSDAYTETNANRNFYYYGGNIAVVGGTLNINGGAVTGGTVSTIRTNAANKLDKVCAYGGNIYASNTAVTISGTTIADGSVSAVGKGVGSESNAFASEINACGGNVYITGGSFSINGGAMTGGSATATSANQAASGAEVNTTKDSVFAGVVRGGNLFVDCTEPTIVGTTISGGSVTNVNSEDTLYDGYNTCQGGNIYVGTGTYLKISGNATVTGGTVAQNNFVRSEEVPAGGGNIFADGSLSVANSTVSNGQLVESHAANANGENLYFYGGNIYVAGSLLRVSGAMVSNGKIDITRSDAVEAGTYTEAVKGLGGNIYTAADTVISNSMIDNGIVKVTVNTKGTAETAFASAEAAGGNIYATGGPLTITSGSITDGAVTLTASNGGDTTADDNASLYLRGGNIALFGVETTFNRVTISGGQLTKTNADYGTDVGGSIYENAESTLTINGRSNITGGINPQGNGGTIYTAGPVSVLGGNLGSTIPADVVPEETVPEETTDPDVVPEDTEPDDSEEEETIPEETTDTEGEETESVIPEVICHNWVGQAYNGGTIYATGEAAVVTIAEGVKLYGGYAGHYGGNLYMGAGSTLNSAGNILLGSAWSGGNVYIDSSTASFTGGQVAQGLADYLYDGLADEDGAGGNMYLREATVTVTDAQIIGGYSYYRGGNVYSTSTSVLSLYGEAEMAEGNIPLTSGHWGGNIYTLGTLKLYDNAVIRDGVAGRGGNVHTGTTNGKIYLYGGQIYGGTAALPDGTNNLRIYNHADVVFEMYGGFVQDLVDYGENNRFQIYNGLVGEDISGEDTVASEGFVPSAEIPVAAACAHNMYAGGHTYISHPEGLCETCGHTYASITDPEPAICALCNTTHINLGHTHTYVDGACSVCGYTLPAHTATCSHGCENVTWVPFDGATLEEGGHYYLTDNTYLTGGQIKVTENVCIDLNGYTLTARRAGQAIYVYKGRTLALMDTSEAKTGTVRGYGENTNAIGGNVRLSGGTMYLYDATVTGGRSLYTSTSTGLSNGHGGNFYLNNGATLIVINGKILDGVGVEGGASARGGNICAYGKSKIVLKGADTLISGGQATNALGDNDNPYGGNIYCGTGSEFYMYDGTVENGNAYVGANIYLMNGKGEDVGYGYMYGGYVGDISPEADKDTVNFMIQGTNTYITNFYMFGGEILSLKDGGTYNEIKVFAGTLHQDPRTVGSDDTDIIGDCACIDYNEETGIYTVGHTQGETTCGICAKRDCGYLNGYGDSHIYTLQDYHNYSGEDHVCVDCQIVRAKLDSTGEHYTELPVALESGELTQDTVVMLRDIDINGTLDIYTTLELNGYALTASGRVDSSNTDGKIHDSVGTGTVQGDGGVYMMETNGQLAINAKNDGVFTYEDIVMYQRNDYVYDETTGEKITDQRFVKFYVENLEKNTLLDNSIDAGADVTFRITITWEQDGVTKEHSFKYVQSWVDEYRAKWDTKMFTCYIAGLDNLTNYTITGEVVSHEVVVQANLVAPSN